MPSNQSKKIYIVSRYLAGAFLKDEKILPALTEIKNTTQKSTASYVMRAMMSQATMVSSTDSG